MLSSADILAIAERHRDRGRHQEAINAFAAVFEAEPGNGAALRGIARCLIDTGKLDDAERHLRLARSAQPGNGEVVGLLGVLAMARDEVHRAEPWLVRGLALAPGSAPVRVDLAALWFASSRRPLVRGLLQPLVAAGAAPVQATAMLSLLDAMETGEERALDACRRALSQDALPMNTAAQLWAFFGVHLMTTGHQEAALAALQRAVFLNPHDPLPATRFALVLAASGLTGEAEQIARRMAEGLPKAAETRRVLGLVLLRRGQLAAARAEMLAAARLAPSAPMALFGLAMVFRHAGDGERALATMDRLARIAPGMPERARLHAELLLLTGAFRPALELREASFRARGDAAPDLLMSAERAIVDGRTIFLIVGEDAESLACLRFARDLSDRGARVETLSPRPLISLLAAMDGVTAAHDVEAAPYRADWFTPVERLPLLCGATLETIGRRVPYLRAPEALARDWDLYLAGLPAPRIGICWSPPPFDDTAPLPDEIPLAPLRAAVEEAGGAPVLLQPMPPDGGFDDWPGLWQAVPRAPRLIDLAAAVAAMDVVVTTDTLIVDLAGALGKRTLLLLLPGAAARWMLQRADSPWYPSVTLFRADATTTVAAAVDRLVAQLRALGAAAPCPAIGGHP